MWSSNPPKNRRRIRITVGMLMLLMVPLALWFAHVTNRARIQRAAIAAFEKSGGLGSVTFGRAGHFIGQSEYDRPPWWQRVVGPEYFREIYGVEIINEEEHVDLSFLRDLPELRSLNLLWTSGCSDEALRSLGSMRHLKSLTLSSTGAGDVALEYIEPLRELQWLDLDDTRVTDAGLKHLKGMTQLQRLSLRNLDISDEGMAQLQGLTGLMDLNVSNVTPKEGTRRITDAGLVYLKGMTRLDSLRLENQRITDAGVGALTGLTRLRILDLSHNPISDAGIKALQSLPNLVALDIRGVDFSDAAVEEFRRAHPKVRIDRWER